MLLMRVGSGARIHIKGNTEVGKRILNQVVVAVNDFLHSNTLLFRTNSYGYTVFVRPTDEKHFLALQAKVAHVDVGRHIHTCEVTNMNTSVGIRQGGSNKRSLKIFHIVIFIIYISLQSYVFRANQRLPTGKFFVFKGVKEENDNNIGAILC